MRKVSARTIGRLLATSVACCGLFVAGVATAGVDLKRIILKPGQCINVPKMRVCAPKDKPAVTVTSPPVTNTVSRTVTSPPVTTTVRTTLTSPPVTVTAPPVTVTTPPITVTTTPTPQIAFRDGTYRVGIDIVPGTYRAVAPTDSCYWERLRGWSGELSDIIANEFNGATIVTILASDVGFRSSRCGGWTRIG